MTQKRQTVVMRMTERMHGKTCSYCGLATESTPYFSNKNKNVKRYHILCSIKVGLLDIEDRFWAKVLKTQSCWIWLGALRTNGYGEFCLRHGSVPMYPHRLAYEIAKGAIPSGLIIDHLCKNPRCVNPQHLEAVTQREHVLRGNICAKIYCKRGHLISENLAPWHKSRTCLLCINYLRRQHHAAKVALFNESEAAHMRVKQQ